MDIKLPMDRHGCSECNPLIIGWCSYVENTKGLMLDQKCPKVAKFVHSVMSKKERRIDEH